MVAPLQKEGNPIPDKNLTCKDCRSTFVFTESEQAFFAEKGFSEPVRCVDCRRRRKAEKESRGRR